MYQLIIIKLYVIQKIAPSAPNFYLTQTRITLSHQICDDKHTTKINTTYRTRKDKQCLAPIGMCHLCKSATCRSILMTAYEYAQMPVGHKIL
jgi:hypothetical protein